MNREEAKELLPIIQAFAEGKKIEYSDGENWIETETPSWSNYYYTYRIKPEPKYRPFRTQEECWSEMHKHQPFGWITLQGRDHPGSKAFIIKITEGCFYYAGIDGHICSNCYSYEFDRHLWLFADGEPFGIKEE